MRLGDWTLFVVTTGFRLTNSTSGQHVSVGGTRNVPWNKTDYLNIFLPRLYRRGHRFRVTTSLLLNPTVFDARTLPFDGATYNLFRVWPCEKFRLGLPTHTFHWAFSTRKLLVKGGGNDKKKTLTPKTVVVSDARVCNWKRKQINNEILFSFTLRL